MLTDVTAEEEFEIKEEEPWYDLQDLEHDLHLAAELGKNLLEKNNELEQSLQQMYATNHEQLQEIEYLSKQVDFLRSINDQHTKLYEQLDLTARDLEKHNKSLVLDNRLAQLKIEQLTEAMVGLQCQVDEMQKELKKVPCKETTQNTLEPQLPDSSLGLPCWKEQHQSQLCPIYESSVSVNAPLEEEQEREGFMHAMRMLQTQLDEEHILREAAEQGVQALAQELSELKPCVAQLDGCRARLAQLEAKAEELEQSWDSDAQHIPSDEDENEPRQTCHVPMYCCSKNHHGVSLLDEVDAQYSALQKKYNELLRHCNDGPQSHKAVQTPTTHQQLTPPPASQEVCTHDNAQLPEYKVLFLEIFTCIQKSKEDLKKNRSKSS